MELAYKEVTREVTTGMDSIFILSYCVRCCLGSIRAARSWPAPGSVGAKCLPAACLAWPGQPSAARRPLFMGATLSPRGKLSLGQHWAPPCQVPNYSSSCSQRPSGPWGKGLFIARGEGKDKESNRKGFKTQRPRRKI